MTTDPVYCAHYDCQCEAAAELTWMSERLHRTDLLLEAAGIFRTKPQVKCRRTSRPSLDKRMDAPLPALNHTVRTNNLLSKGEDDGKA
jgi:hypothetical protein